MAEISIKTLQDKIKSIDSEVSVLNDSVIDKQNELDLAQANFNQTAIKLKNEITSVNGQISQLTGTKKLIIEDIKKIEAKESADELRAVNG